MSEPDARDDADEAWPEEWTKRERELVERVESEFGEHRDDLERRHWIQALSALGLVSSGSRELYRRDVLQALPALRYRLEQEPERWEASWHPSRDSVGEGLASAGGFAALVALASAGSRRRAKDQPLLSLATAGMGLLQAVGTARRLVDDLKRGDVDAFSSIETILSASAVPLALPEAIRAIGELIGSRRR